MAAPAASTSQSKPGDYGAVRASIKGVLKQPGYDDGSAGPVLVRLAWHCSGTYDRRTNTGGSDGAGIRFENEGGDPSNAGLENARAFLEPIKQAHPWITYADLYTFAGVVAIEEMGGPKIEWRPGRSDYADDTRYPGRGRLPDGAQGSDHLRAVFTDALGFNDQEIVALSGAHALGRCHSDRSGFDGPWVVNPTRFSNNYFKMLVNLDWQPRQWDGPFQYHNEELGESLMMLPTDKALCEDPALKPWVERYAKDKELFFDHFAKAFATLLELGVRRDKHPATPLDHELPHLRSKL